MAKRRTLWDYNEMGLYFYGREAYDLAIRDFKRAVRAAFYPIATLHVNLGAAYLGKKMYADARVHLLKGLALDPHHQKAHWFLAQTLRATGTASQAVAEFERTWTINPDSAEGRQGREILDSRGVLTVEVEVTSNNRVGFRSLVRRERRAGSTIDNRSKGDGVRPRRLDGREADDPYRSASW